MCADEGGRGSSHLLGFGGVMELSGQQLDEGIHIAAVEQLAGDAGSYQFGAAIGAGGNDGQADGLCLGNDVGQSFPLRGQHKNIGGLHQAGKIGSPAGKSHILFKAGALNGLLQRFS